MRGCMVVRLKLIHRRIACCRRTVGPWVGLFGSREPWRFECLAAGQRREAGRPVGKERVGELLAGADLCRRAWFIHMAIHSVVHSPHLQWAGRMFHVNQGMASELNEPETLR